MAKRITITDVAEAAGVSVATVDRVLNGRHKVREATAKRVYEAANQLGYYAANVIRARLQQYLPHYRLGILLQRPRHVFYQEMARMLEAYVRQNPQLGVKLVIEYLTSQIPSEVAEHITRLGETVHGLVVTTIDHALITAAVKALSDKNIPVFSILSDCAHGVRAGYIGLDNRKVGRTAAWMISHLAKKSGKVAVFVGSHRFLGHELREMGFRTYFREHAPQFEVIDTLINLEVRQITHEAVLELLERHPDLVGFYVAGGGMEGAIAAMRDSQHTGEVIAVCNELTPESRAGLANNILSVVITTPIEQVAQEVIEQLLVAIEKGNDSTPSQTFLPFGIYVSENI